MSSNSSRINIVLLVKNAEKHILDWVSWHLGLGVSRIIVADAGSIDGTKSLIEDLAHKWPIELLAPLLDPELTSQERRLALTQQALEQLSDKNEWVLFLDIDEYLCPDTSLKDLLDKAHKTGAMAIRWCIFGNNQYRKKLQEHLVARQGWRADINLPDHKFVRILARLSDLKQFSTIKDPVTLDIPAKSWITTAGKPWSKDEPLDHLWEGGRILHYICNDDETSPLSSLMKRYFSYRLIRDVTGFRHLDTARLMRNRLCSTLFAAGLQRLKEMVHKRQWSIQTEAETDLSLPDKAQRFGFSYKRVRMCEEEVRLISPQANPPSDLTRVFLLRTPDKAFLLADSEKKGESRVLLCLTQDRYPHLAMLYCTDRRNFALKDVISFDQCAITFLKPTSRENLVTLAVESGRDNLYFDMISFMEPNVPVVQSLPAYDEPHGLSMTGLLEWLSTCPHTRNYDIRRVLLLLTEEAAQSLGRIIPALQPFMQDRLPPRK